MRSLALLVLLLVPVASAGTAEEPEVVDPKGDCAFAPGNHYLDVVSAWISDETADAFNVNIQLAEWVQPVADGAGFVVQFQHQGVKFGVLAGYVATQWGYGNGRIEGNNVEVYNETTGSFKASPPTVTVLFHKDNFPHTNAMDHQLVDFTGGSVDLKPLVPFFLLPAPLPIAPVAIECDDIIGQKPYSFQVGAHAHNMASMNATGMNETAMTTHDEPKETVPAATKAPQKSVAGFEAAALVAVGVALALRRR